MGEAAGPHRGGADGVGRQGASAAGFAPEAGDGAEGDVEGAAGLLGERLAALEDIEQLRAHGHGRAGGDVVKAREFARRVVVGENTVERGDAIKGGAGGGRGGFGGVDDDAEKRAHVRLDEFVPLLRGGRGDEREPRRGEFPARHGGASWR